jgi:RNA recognition motif. (a.k.a. RRM, RBD, or RNP domain)
MMRHRTGPAQGDADGSSSSSDEDVFSALSRKRKVAKQNHPGSTDVDEDSQKKSKASAADATTPPPSDLSHAKNLPILAQTSSTKRHHLSSASDAARQSKMDAILLELEAERNRKASAKPASSAAAARYVPDKKGSYVDPGDEHRTTNIFVGNLAPTITEEQMTELFRQFGEKYLHSLQFTVNYIVTRAHEILIHI